MIRASVRVLPVTALVVSASVAGYHVIMRMQSVLTWITGIATIVYVGLTLDEIDWTAVRSIPDGSTQQMVGALVLVMTGFGLGWINIAADWSRYQRRDASGAAIVGWNTFGGAVAPVSGPVVVQAPGATTSGVLPPPPAPTAAATGPAPSQGFEPVDDTVRSEPLP